MMGKIAMQKYVDPGIPIVKTHINGIEIPNTLIDLGEAINIMSRQTMEQLKLPNLLYTPTLLQLVDRLVIKLDGVLEDILVSLDSWEYPVNFMILTPKNNLGVHPLILGRPWLATTDAFTSCRSGDMYISDGNSTKKFTLYPPEKAIKEIDDKEWINDEDDIQPLFTITEISEDSQILNTMENFETSSEYDHAQFQEISNIEYLSSSQMSLYSMEEFGSSTIEIFLGMTLNINKNLEKLQQEELTKILQKHSAAFAWEYTDMKGIDPKTCIHHIYIEENSRPIRQPQKRMNPNLREIVKEELKELLNVNFIYPISDSQWVSPLVIVPKKNGKWRVCIDYRELNKETLKDNFPLPFIDQVLDTLAVYGNTFEEALENLEKVLKRCKEPNLSLSHEKCLMMFIEGYETFVHIDHSAIRYLMDKPIINGRVTRWLLILQEFNITVLDRPKKQNTVVDFLSRIQNIKEDSPVEDKFPREKRKIIQESARYSWITKELYKIGLGLMIRRCVREDEMLDILKACHDEPCGGHFTDNRTTYKILSLGYYWPYIFKDAKEYARRCNSCQRVGKPAPSNEMPLQTQVLIEPFEK
eukprot:PITA_34423